MSNSMNFFNPATNQWETIDYPGGGGGKFTVTLTETEGVLSADKTFAEIKAAYDAGMSVVASTSGEGDFSLVSIGEQRAMFTTSYAYEGGALIASFYLYTDDGVDTWTAVPFSAESVDAYTKTETDDLLDGKVDKVMGKGLSSNDYTDADKSKVAAAITNLVGYATEAWVNAQGYATQAWVQAQGFVTSLVGYATEVWVQSQGYGTYSKPAGGIPKTDLAASVQTSLGLADTALQEHQSLSAYRSSAAQDIIDSAKLDANQGAANAGKLMGVDEDGDVVPVEAPSAAEWGAITGTLADQTDLKAALDAKSDFSGSYNDLANKPTIPTALSQLSADSTHRLVSDTEKTTWNGKEDKSSKVTEITSASDDNHYPTAKAVYNAFANAFSVVVTANDDTLGTVTGTGLYSRGDTVTLTAAPIGSDSQFLKWIDTFTGETVSTENPGTYVCAGNRSVRAIFSAPIDIVSWSTGTDAQIAAMIRAADNGIIDLSDYWSIGDARTVHLSATAAESSIGIEAHAEQDVEFVMLDFVCKGFVDPESGKKINAIIGLKDCLTEKGKMNTAVTNVGGWKDCMRRKWCNNQFYYSVPSSIRPIFKKFEWQCVQSGTNGTLNTVQDFFALAPAKAIFGSGSYSRSEEAALFAQWDYYSITSNRIKHKGIGGAASTHRECSPYAGGTEIFCFVSANGSQTGAYPHYDEGLAPFGCI